jgi:hypothetical protein
MLHHTQKNLLKFFRKIMAVYSNNFTKYINTACGQNTEILNVNAGCTQAYVYYCVLRE